MKSFIKQSDGQQRLYRLLWLCFIKIESQVYERNFSNKADRSVIRSAPFYSQPKESLIFIANVSRKRNTEQKKLWTTNILLLLLCFIVFFFHLFFLILIYINTHSPTALAFRTKLSMFFSLFFLYPFLCSLFSTFQVRVIVLPVLPIWTFLLPPIHLDQLSGRKERKTLRREYSDK